MLENARKVAPRPFALGGMDAAVTNALAGVLQSKTPSLKTAWYTQPSREAAKAPLLMRFLSTPALRHSGTHIIPQHPQIVSTIY